MKFNEAEMAAMDRAAAYNSPEGVAFRKAFAKVRNWWTWCSGSYSELGIFGQQKFCSIGALDAAGGGISRTNAAAAVYSALRKTIGGPVVDFNDSSLHRTVVRAWRQTGEANGWL